MQLFRIPRAINILSLDAHVVSHDKQFNSV